jgi:hypothetical protein
VLLHKKEVHQLDAAPQVLVEAHQLNTWARGWEQQYTVEQAVNARRPCSAVAVVLHSSQGFLVNVSLQAMQA